MKEPQSQDKRVTDLPSRSQAVESIQSLLALGKEQANTRFSVFLLNLNRFRSINESLSYATGDRVIREVGKRLLQVQSDIDTVAHLGGDEFALVMPRVENIDVATRIAEAITTKIAASIRFRNREVFVSVSIGIVVGGSDYAHAEDMLRDADIALAQAKAERVPSVVFQRSMRTQAVKRQQIETDLRYAIVCNELEIYYQPIVRLNDVALCGAEALVRWNHPINGLMSPAEFIPVAESSGLIKPMTIGILKASCLQLVQWNEQRNGSMPLMVSVNLSSTHFNEPDLVDRIRSVVDETGIVPAHLKLEITEGAVMEDPANAVRTLKSIKKLGVSISIDDFGTGYSSLSYLHKFPIDNLKIDRSFVAEMENSNENLQIVKTIITLANSLSLSVIAEGVETENQWRMLDDMGCQFGQGYFFARPMVAGEMTELILEESKFSSMSPPASRPELSEGSTDAIASAYPYN